jgi:carboxypeptidase C (cathepsin A)
VAQPGGKIAPFDKRCLLDHTELVFINPVGTAYSTAIVQKNIDFWGIDEDAHCIKQFVKRYLTAFNRWNSPKFTYLENLTERRELGKCPEFFAHLAWAERRPALA